MGEWVNIQRAVSIAGQVRDASTQQPISGALVSIIKGPPEFDEQLHILSGQPDWLARTRRLDQTVSRPDGMYWFVRLPKGLYTLRVGAPHMGSRFGVVELEGIRVWATREPTGRIKLDPADATLPPTMIHGTVKHHATQQPIGRAKVRLLGTPDILYTQADGTFRLTNLVAGRPTLEVSAPQFQMATQTVTVTAGRDVAVTVELTPLT